jgi:hypothetical protein
MRYEEALEKWNRALHLQLFLPVIAFLFHMHDTVRAKDA